MKNLPKTYRTRFSQGLRLNPAIACLATALWVTLASPAALAAVKGWDSGLANDLFKDGNPPGQLREAKCKDKDCIDAMENLQAALNDWYALELSEGQQDKKDAVSIQDKADNKAKNDEGDAKINICTHADFGVTMAMIMAVFFFPLCFMAACFGLVRRGFTRLTLGRSSFGRVRCRRIACASATSARRARARIAWTGGCSSKHASATD